MASPAEVTLGEAEADAGPLEAASLQPGAGALFGTPAREPGLPPLVYHTKLPSSAVVTSWDEHTSVAPRKLTRIARVLHGEGRRLLVVSSDDEISSD